MKIDRLGLSKTPPLSSAVRKKGKIEQMALDY